MLMPKKNRVSIYEHLFKEGVMVAEKDFFLAKHPEVDVPNLHVIKTMQSLRSRGYVTEKFSWRHFYWYLTNEGINYLREFLHLPPEIVPATLKRQVRPEGSSRPRPSRGDRPSGDAREGREGRDSRDSRKTDEKQAAVGSGGGEFQFRGGYGRGSSSNNQS